MLIFCFHIFLIIVLIFTDFCSVIAKLIELKERLPLKKSFLSISRAVPVIILNKV